MSMKLFFVITLISLIIFFAVLSFQIYMVSNTKVPQFSNPERVVKELGSTNSDSLKYLVMGDSTAAGQGAEYTDGIAYQTAQKLSEQYQVKLLNTGISGAKVADILSDQINVVKQFNPDLVLLSVGANDVTHLTSSHKIESGLDEIVDALIKNNCNVKIIVTGAPEMGSVQLFPQPLRFIAGLRTKQINNVFQNIVREEKITIAPIAAKTGSRFKNDASLFASDRFHPNKSGYAIWIPVINSAINEALEKPMRCKVDY